MSTAQYDVPFKQSSGSESPSFTYSQSTRSYCQTPVTGARRSPTESLKLWMIIFMNSGSPLYILPWPSSFGTLAPRITTTREKKTMKVKKKKRKGPSAKIL